MILSSFRYPDLMNLGIEIYCGGDPPVTGGFVQFYTYKHM